MISEMDLDVLINETRGLRGLNSDIRKMKKHIDEYEAMYNEYREDDTYKAIVTMFAAHNIILREEMPYIVDYLVSDEFAKLKLKSKSMQWFRAGAKGYAAAIINMYLHHNRGVDEVTYEYAKTAAAKIICDKMQYVKKRFVFSSLKVKGISPAKVWVFTRLMRDLGYKI